MRLEKCENTTPKRLCEENNNIRWNWREGRNTACIAWVRARCCGIFITNNYLWSIRCDSNGNDRLRRPCCTSTLAMSLFYYYYFHYYCNVCSRKREEGEYWRSVVAPYQSFGATQNAAQSMTNTYKQRWLTQSRRHRSMKGKIHMPMLKKNPTWMNWEKRTGRKNSNTISCSFSSSNMYPYNTILYEFSINLKEKTWHNSTIFSQSSVHWWLGDRFE